MIQWLGFSILTTESLGSIPDQEAKILQSTQHNQKKPQIKLRFNSLVILDTFRVPSGPPGLLVTLLGSRDLEPSC